MVHSRSAWARLVPALAILYFASLFAVLLYPFECSSPFAARDNSASWPDGARGVRLGPSGVLVSAEPPTRLHQRLTSGRGLTVELWLSAAPGDQYGPARVMSYSLNPWQRNFALGQEGRDLVVRLRTTTTDANGVPGLEVADAFADGVPGALQHIVVTYDFAEERVYIDGRLRAASALHPGGFETWDPGFFLIFGDEVFGARPWDGTIAYAALFDRPLSGGAVAARFEAGYRQIDPAARPLLAFDFTQGPEGLASGAVASGTIAPLPRLTKPARVAIYSRPFFLYLGGRMIFAASSPWDIIRNVILFMTFGVFGFAFAGRRGRPAASAILLTVAAAAAVSASCETLQFFQDARTSSILDLATNTAGALLGAIGCRYGLRHGVVRQWRQWRQRMTL
jgi:hypothetical protein